MERKVFISNYPFARYDQKPLEMLKQTGVKIEVNSLERKMLPEETLKAAGDCEIIIAGTENLTPLVENSSALKLISRIGIGLDSVPLQLCRKKNILVAYTPDAVTEAVTDLTMGMMIALLRKITLADREIREKKWVRHYGKSLSSCTIGIIGFGRVGFSVAKHLLPFHPSFLINDIINVDKKIQTLQNAGANIVKSTKEDIFQKADITTLHIPYTSLTKNLINKDTLNQMKKDSVLLNLSRGEIIHENDLYEFLLQEPLFQAGLDVFCKEPYRGELTQLSNITLTQHMGACTFSGRQAMEKQAVESVIEYINGQTPKRLVPEEEYRYQTL